MNIKYYYCTESQYVKCPNYMEKYYGCGVTEYYPKSQQFLWFHLWLSELFFMNSDFQLIVNLPYKVIVGALSTDELLLYITC